jgi:hypothetical protein
MAPKMTAAEAAAFDARLLQLMHGEWAHFSRNCQVCREGEHSEGAYWFGLVTGLRLIESARPPHLATAVETVLRLAHAAMEAREALLDEQDAAQAVTKH